MTTEFIIITYKYFNMKLSKYNNVYSMYMTISIFYNGIR